MGITWGLPFSIFPCCLPGMEPVLLTVNQSVCGMLCAPRTTYFKAISLVTSRPHSHNICTAAALYLW